MANLNQIFWNSIYSGGTGGVSDLATGYAVASQLPGRHYGGPADVVRHLVLWRRAHPADLAQPTLAKSLRPRRPTPPTPSTANMTPT